GQVSRERSSQSRADANSRMWRDFVLNLICADPDSICADPDSAGEFAPRLSQGRHGLNGLFELDQQAHTRIWRGFSEQSSGPKLLVGRGCGGWVVEGDDVFVQGLAGDFQAGVGAQN